MSRGLGRKRTRRRAPAAALLGGLFALAAAPMAGAEADGVLVVAPAPALVESGLLQHLAPRFRFKTGVSIEIAAPGAAAPGLKLIAWDQADGPGAPFAERDGVVFAAEVMAGADEAEATRLTGWLLSDAGGRAIARYAPPEGAPFAPIGAGVGAARQATAAPQDHAEGERLALRHCGRCHVIGARNKYGGIGSTPSFPALKAIPTWREKFAAFWQANPHPSFMQIEDVTEPFSEARPPHIAPVALTLLEAEAIIAYAETIAPADLGANVAPR